LLHHHGHDGQLSEAERDRLLSEGAAVDGIVLHSELSAADRLISQVRVEVWFKDGQKADFTEEVANQYQPVAGSPEAQRLAEARQAEQFRHADRIPKIQIPLSDGERVPVRYDPANRSKLVLDVPAMQKRAMLDYIKREQRPKQPKNAHAVRTGPPWVVPAHCPNCGAPVDQAKASRDPDPFCRFCTQPIPVTPLQTS
jgi:hypothetical protein